MLRKLSLVAVAAASLGVAALAPTSASAWGLAWRLARWWLASRLGWPPRLRRRSGLLRRRLWRLLCAAPGRHPLGPALEAGEPLLLI